MPYGLPKDLNTETNNAKIERCVEQLTHQGRTKQQAIKICKASIIRSARN